MMAKRVDRFKLFLAKTDEVIKRGACEGTRPLKGDKDT